MYDIIIVGAGPAGLTSAIYARRALKKVLVFEALSYGGQIVNTLKIDNYPAMPGVSGVSFATSLFNQTKDLGAEIKFEKVLNIEDKDKYKKVTTNIGIYKSKTVIIASGCDSRKLGISREDKLTGRGISYCAMCDGAFYKGKDVAVAGGGNSAIEDALYMSDIARKVYLIHRREEFTAEEALVNKLIAKENVEFILNENITKLNGQDKLESIEVGSRTIEVSGLFIEVGRVPSNENFRKIIEVNNSGYVSAKENCHTNVAGIYVAGDVRVKKVRQLVTAVSDGAVAAMEAIKFINGGK